MVSLAYGSAAKQARQSSVLRHDTTTVNVRNFDTAALAAFNKQYEFQYKEKIDTSSIWARFWIWAWNGWKGFWQWLAHFFSASPTKSGAVNSVILYILKYLTIFAGVSALIFLIFKIAGVDMLNIFRRKSATVSLPYSEFFEDINAINFDEDIENAVARGNYRFAVRLLYLKCLKQLSDAELIKWHIDKTNDAYANELVSEDKRHAFKQLTRQFEYIWYGEFLIDRQLYKNIHSSFRDFNENAG